jgi:hypothetical protein
MRSVNLGLQNHDLVFRMGHLKCLKANPRNAKILTPRPQLRLKMSLIFYWPFLYQGKDIIVFRFIIEYSSLRDFYRPLGNNRFIFVWGFLKGDILGLC